MSRVIKSGQIVSDGVKIGVYQPGTDNSPGSGNEDSPPVEELDDQERKGYYSLIIEEKQKILDYARGQARQSAARILEEAYSQRDKIMNTATEESQRIRDEAYREGYLKGLTESRTDVEGGLEKLNGSVAGMAGQLDLFQKEMEGQTVDLALAMMEKVLKRKVEEDEAVLADMVEKAVLSERDKNSLIVHLPDSSMELLCALEERLEPLIGRNGGVGTVKLKPASLSPGTVRVETEEGIVDASLEVQIENLKKQLASFGGQP